MARRNCPIMASTSAADGYQVIELRPVTEGDGWDSAALAAAMSPTTLPPGLDENGERAYLAATRGWQTTRGLFGYSKDSPYKDYYVYFDGADKTSPINVAASKAFRCYGLDGKQHVMDWEVVRGPCVVMRLPPPKMISFHPVLHTRIEEQMDFPHNPLITIKELVATLLFFKDRDARKVALKRDATRALMDVPKDHPLFTSGTGFYFSPVGTRPADTVAGKDARQCGACGKPNTIACNLKACSLCKAAWYCDKVCQKKDFARHKRECARLGQQRAAQAPPGV